MDYHKMIEPMVMKVLSAYLTDYTEHDKKSLDGYTGKFFYAYRRTGTDVLCIDMLKEAVLSLERGIDNGFFTERAINSINEGRLNLYDSLLVASLERNGANSHFLIGEKGKVKMVKSEKFSTELKKEIDALNERLLRMKNKMNLKVA